MRTMDSDPEPRARIPTKVLEGRLRPVERASALACARAPEELRAGRRPAPRADHRGRLARGERLPNETLLAREFGVSRATVREALRLLAAQNLIRTAKGAGGGSYVTLPTVDHLSDYMTLEHQPADRRARPHARGADRDADAARGPRRAARGAAAPGSRRRAPPRGDPARHARARAAGRVRGQLRLPHAPDRDAAATRSLLIATRPLFAGADDAPRSARASTRRSTSRSTRSTATITEAIEAGRRGRRRLGDDEPPRVPRPALRDGVARSPLVASLTEVAPSTVGSGQDSGSSHLASAPTRPEAPRRRDAPGSAAWHDRNGVRHGLQQTTQHLLPSIVERVGRRSVARETWPSWTRVRTGTGMASGSAPHGGLTGSRRASGAGAGRGWRRGMGSSAHRVRVAADGRRTMAAPRGSGRSRPDRRGRRSTWRPLRLTLGVEAFGINAYSADAGDPPIVALRRPGTPRSASRSAHDGDLPRARPAAPLFTPRRRRELDVPAGTATAVRSLARRRVSIASAVAAVDGDDGRRDRQQGRLGVPAVRLGGSPSRSGAAPGLGRSPGGDRRARESARTIARGCEHPLRPRLLARPRRQRGRGGRPRPACDCARAAVRRVGAPATPISPPSAIGFSEAPGGDDDPP